jgi:hypothetical protein
MTNFVRKAIQIGSPTPTSIGKAASPRNKARDAASSSIATATASALQAPKPRNVTIAPPIASRSRK